MNGAGRAGDGTATASVTKFRENESLFEYGDCVVLADFCTLAAACTFYLVHNRDQDASGFSGCDFRLEKDMAVRFFDIAIQILNRLVHAGEHPRQVDRHSGFACSAFSACDGYVHGFKR